MERVGKRTEGKGKNMRNIINGDKVWMEEVKGGPGNGEKVRAEMYHVKVQDPGDKCNCIVL